MLFGITGVDGAGTQAYLSFIGAGVASARTITVSLLNLQLLNSNLLPIDATIQNATVTVNAVPEPASLLLAASGLAAAWRGRAPSAKRRARAA